MQIKFKVDKPTKVSLDGCKVLEVSKGDIVPVPKNCEGVALDFIKKGYCDEFEAPVKSEDKKVKAPRNKDTPSAK